MRPPDQRLLLRTLLGLAAGAAIFGLVACGKQEAPQSKAADPPRTAVTAPPPPPPKVVPKPTEVAITGVHLGLGTGAHNQVAKKTTVFAPQDKVMVSVYSDGRAKTASIGVTWLAAGGKVLGEETRQVQYNGSLATLFAYPRPADLVPGTYQVEVRLDEWLAEKATFTVQ
jgi:hypothetical protein